MFVRASDALTADTVMVRPAWTSFEATIQGMVDQLVATGRLASQWAAVAVERICERERMASTAMVTIGVSIPHCRLDGVQGIVAAMAVSPEGVYQVADGAPISIVILVLSSPALTGEHLTFLSSVSMLLQSERAREQLRHAASADEVMRFLRSQERGRG